MRACDAFSPSFPFFFLHHCMCVCVYASLPSRHIHTRDRAKTQNQRTRLVFPFPFFFSLRSDRRFGVRPSPYPPGSVGPVLHRWKVSAGWLFQPDRKMLEENGSADAVQQNRSTYAVFGQETTRYIFNLKHRKTLNLYTCSVGGV